MGNKLDGLAHRIDDHIRELHDLGQFPDVYESIVLAIQRRQRKLRERVDAAIRGGRTWDIVKAELATLSRRFAVLPFADAATRPCRESR